MGHIKDCANFSELYGINERYAQRYLSMNPAAIESSFTKNSRMETDRRDNKQTRHNLCDGGISRRGVKWDSKLQESFENVLRFVEEVSALERESFGLDVVDTRPEKLVWLRISLSDSELF